MPITINGRVYMNLQEAVAWLLNNNALPFQCKVNFVADTEISKTDIINPAPAELKIGSLVLFADGFVGTVNAVTTNGFKVGSEATDLSAGVPHITGMEVNASGHLIITMSEGDPIDAGLIKQLSSMSIDASQHLIANYNDGTSTDLGAIFQGNINIAGNLTADSIIENMSGYSASITAKENLTNIPIYVGMVKNGNKLTLVYFSSLIRTGAISGFTLLCNFAIPNSIGSKLYPFLVAGSNTLDYRRSTLVKRTTGAFLDVPLKIYKSNDTQINVMASSGALDSLDLNEEYLVRYEATFLLSDSLI